MNNGTCAVFVLFYIFRHYKRVGETSKRKEMVSDLKKCYSLLKRMKKNVPPDDSSNLIRALIIRINSFGANMEFQQPLRYVDIYDHDIIKIMTRLTGETIKLAKHSLHGRFSGEILTRLLVLHNLPRALLYDSSGDLSTPNNFHISKQDVLECIATNLGDLRSINCWSCLKEKFKKKS